MFDVSMIHFSLSLQPHTVYKSYSFTILFHLQEKYGRPCRACTGRGFYPCKLCKASGTIQWSPLYDPLVINPCLCPTCDGLKVQHCLNCLGSGFV
ncbi:unnamed protein product [Coffea canephora]|uniref:Uncharacterized protein n=1 Tax=Coffea canephora TaxID=49390 RepID=A0A068U9G5_COFCA|nr:unnamed protein product [Coffea canephora]